MGAYASANGLFTVVPEVTTGNGRPVYVNSNGYYLYYWAEFEAWRIGLDYDSALASAASRSGEATTCPHHATWWTSFSSDDEMIVSCPGVVPPFRQRIHV